MGKIADLAGIQYRTLNESKGHAVHSTRVQVDKKKYSEIAEKIIQESAIEIIYSKVSQISKEKNDFLVSFDDSPPVRAKKLIITGGTFLKGILHRERNKRGRSN